MEPTKKIYLFDTTVFIDYLRGKAGALPWMENAMRNRYDAGISIITDLELWVGLQPNEINRHKVLLSKFRRFQFQLTIARRAGELYRPFVKSEKCLGDVIIAATAEYYKADIVTRNPAHFRRLPLNGVEVVAYSV